MLCHWDFHRLLDILQSWIAKYIYKSSSVGSCSTRIARSPYSVNYKNAWQLKRLTKSICNPLMIALI